AWAIDVSFGEIERLRSERSAGSTYTLRASCCVIELPPLPEKNPGPNGVRFSKAALARPRKLTPGLLKKLGSSVATVAATRKGDMRSSETGLRTPCSGSVNW